MWIVKVAGFLAVAFAGVASILYFKQTSMLFPADRVGAPPPLAAGAERLLCETSEGETLHGVRIPASAETGGTGATLIGFGGNGWNAEAMAAYLHEQFPANEIIAFHYRGYRPSTGTPSAKALLGDALQVHDCITGPSNPRKVVAVGFSIGTGVAAHLARNRPLDGVILVTPFDRLDRLVSQHYPWLPVRLLLRHHMAPADDLREVSAPVAIIAAENDTIIPSQRTAPLREAASDLVLDRTIAGTGHNSIYDDAGFTRTMREALQMIEDQTDPAPASQPSPEPTGLSEGPSG